MTKDQKQSMKKILSVIYLEGEKEIKEEYYTAYGLAEKLPGKSSKGHMAISTVYALQKEGMPCVFSLAGQNLVPVADFGKVLAWVKTRKSFSLQRGAELARRRYDK